MRNSVEITRKYQIGNMIVQHLFAAFVSIVFELVACWYFLDKPVARYIVAAVFTVVYAGMLYSRAHKLASFDKKSYTPLQPELKWGFIWGLCISATMAFAIIVFRLNWMLFSDGTSMNNVFSSFINILFYIWTAPYFGFISDTGGVIPVFAMILMVLVPIAASALGYVAGVNDFDILAKLDSMTVEKDTDDEE
ncbi:MAG TPA: hypothetical protein IAA61_00525 [Candidatus Ornithomonoglobus merdipullorum]|uniref:Uncharacterized protein n=1 Tax=Candidatus Ornithomonoglobus merdipullorum TaxID=2840895 RepID=A0A9D1MA49_9FIRM|nr:hypothetical protein [Candidatus Ornithomonoglobus merdipullorum]